MFSYLALAAVSAAGLVFAADPCTVATTSAWVSAKDAHACELNVPFDKTRSLAVIDTCIKALQYYSLETWFLASPNPLIPHSLDIRSLLTEVQGKTSSSGYPTDWDFNTAVADVYNREKDGHTVFTPSCTSSFSFNLPFSIATLAKTPFDTTAVPTFLVNYDFPDQGRDGIEDYYESVGVSIRPYDGAEITTINGQDAYPYLVGIADNSSLYNGLFASLEDVQVRFQRLMSRYSADTADGGFTVEVGRHSQRAYYPGTESISVGLTLSNGTKVDLTIPWVATFVGNAANDTASFITNNCIASANSTLNRREEYLATNEARAENFSKRANSGNVKFASPNLERLRAVEKAGYQGPVRASKAKGGRQAASYVTPNLTSFGHFVTLDIYQLKEHPKVGVVYFEQFEPRDPSIDFFTYIDGISGTIFTGLSSLKDAGVEKILIDVSGNRGGYIFAGAVALWSLWPADLYPGFPAVFRDLDLTRRESDHASSTNDSNSEYNFRFYRNLSYILLTSNEQFLDPPVPQTVNGVQDAYSQPFFDDFGNNSAAVTNFTSPPFQAEDYVIVSNGICGSTCSIFSSYLYQKHGIPSAVFGGLPTEKVTQFDGGVKGSEVTELSQILLELEDAGLDNDPNAPQPLPIKATLTSNYRNAIPYIDQEDGILEYVYEPDTKKFQFTSDNFNKPQIVWEFVAEQFFPGL